MITQNHNCNFLIILHCNCIILNVAQVILMYMLVFADVLVSSYICLHVNAFYIYFHESYYSLINLKLIL